MYVFLLLKSLVDALPLMLLAEMMHSAVVRAAPGVVNNAVDWGFSGAMLSVPRSSIAATSVGHLALFAGGKLQNGTSTDIVDIFDRKTNKWTTARLSEARSEISAGSVAGRYALFAGGFDNSFKPMTLVDVYDAKSGQWSQIRLGTARAAPRMLDLGNRTAIVGGLSGDLQYLSNAVDYVDAKLGVISVVLESRYPQLGVAVSDHVGGIGLYTSGYENIQPGHRFNDFEAANRTTVFTAQGTAVGFNGGAQFPFPRWGASGAAANGVFVVGGGHVFSNGDEELTTTTDRVDVYHTATGKWSNTALKMSVARDYPLAQAVGNYVVFVSGTQLSKDFDILDTRTSRFVDTSEHRPALHTLRSDAAAATVDGCLLVIAGGSVYGGRNKTASVEMFDACSGL
ncbi:hypothetical protein COEREDRAFT_92597 [Coemansia reversa NRRL 1564]|uniref:Galactose oxidase n=1 Tax=Coemansia reversa (strain ATCC 12441 / NRRL 1564) TaxID=763665 RepID=A0A2G5BC53_COERN|nr:hypothetical protein COEREDRAFT_92597 [Coemansia reversa NRRL 1564]|eukprot:PIA16287.1 hypothetical protein COEREDRAFT_92597 [Coemansia reversa NRRL 1564]